MPSKESLAVASRGSEEIRNRLSQTTTIKHMGPAVFACIEQIWADLLDEAIREAEVALLQRIREEVEREDSVGDVMSWLWVEQQRLAQLREGKT